MCRRGGSIFHAGDVGMKSVCHLLGLVIVGGWLLDAAGQDLPLETVVDLGSQTATESRSGQDVMSRGGSVEEVVSQEVAEVAEALGAALAGGEPAGEVFPEFLDEPAAEVASDASEQSAEPGELSTVSPPAMTQESSSVAAVVSPEAGHEEQPSEPAEAVTETATVETVSESEAGAAIIEEAVTVPMALASQAVVSTEAESTGTVTATGVDEGEVGGVEVAVGDQQDKTHAEIGGEMFGQSGLTAAAYDELIHENLELRRKIDELLQSEAKAREQNEALTAEIRDLEQKIRDMADLVTTLQAEQRSTAPEETEKLKELEERLAQAEAEKSRLTKQLEDLNQRLAAAPAPLSVTPELPAPSVPSVIGTGETVQPDSDLFKRLEQENILLRKNLEELKAERERLAREAQQQQELREALAKAKTSEQQSREVMEKLLQRIPELEKELAALRSNTEKKDETLQVKDKDLEAFRLELERRENRLIKAERMAALLAKTREELKQVSEREKRDMHYNMAAVYAKEGKYREAEQEYLRALEIDPTDADSHYNLAILYDEQLNDKRRAALHYRRYLKLRPNAPDVDIVKNWLMEIEMGRR